MMDTDLHFDAAFYYLTDDGERVYLTTDEQYMFDAYSARVDVARRSYEDEGRALRTRVLARAAAEAKTEESDE